ncbi:MAG: OmpA family protein [Alphaproteobacteria bacterium]|nr:OmpA family protein [Alphaproteobacteria bacterium]
MKKLFLFGFVLFLSGCAGLLNEPNCRLSEDEYVAKIAEAQLAAVLHFENGKADLKQHELDIIKQVAARAARENTAVVVYGHASHRTLTKDPIQRILINLDISNERALNVMKALTSAGVAKDKISAIAMFDSRPIKKEITRADEAANRRAEIYLYWLK